MGNKPGVILCTHCGAYASIVLKRLLQSEALNVIGVINSTRVLKKQESALKSGLQLVQQCGLAYAMSLSLVTTGYNLLSRVVGADSVYSLARKHGIPVFNTSDINDAASIQFIREQQPDYIVSAFFNQLIGTEARAITPGRCMNIHPSLLPNYKGVDPAFYIRLNQESEFGVTLHHLDEGFHHVQGLYPRRERRWHRLISPGSGALVVHRQRRLAKQRLWASGRDVRRC